MDTNIRQSIETQDDGGVFLLDRGYLFRHRSEIVRQHLGISSPAFHITSEIQDGAYRIRVLCEKVGRLVEMAGIAFMRQGGEKV